MEAGLPAGSPSSSPPGATAGLVFKAPAGDDIVGGEVRVYGQSVPETARTYYDAHYAELAGGNPKRLYWQKNRGLYTVAIPRGGTQLFASAVCEANPCDYQNVYVVGAHIELSPSAVPAVSTIGGSVSTGGPVHGTQSVSFTASDEGGPGVYQVTVAVDGNVIYQGTPNPNGGMCAPIGIFKGSPEFYSVQPCPLSAPVSVPVHTGTLADGIHALTVTASDAAGDLSRASVILFRSENLISGAGAGRVPRGVGAGREPAYVLHFDPATAVLLRGVHRSFTGSALSVSGNLTTPQGVAAPGVAVHLVASTNGAQRVLSTAMTDATGHWTLTAPRGSTRTLRVDYGQASAASAQGADVAREIVSPTVSLRVSDRRGGRLMFTGRVAIAPLGRPRPIVVIEASSDGRQWQTLGHEVRTNSRGVYHLPYSSPLSVGGRFAFRAMTPATSEWQQGLTGPRWLVVR